MSPLMPDSPNQPLLRASHVSVDLNGDGPQVRLVNDVSFDAYADRTLVIVGESGAGKSMLARTLCGLTPSGLRPFGQVEIAGQHFDLAPAASQVSRVRGSGIVWLPQDPFTSLSPTHRVGEQILSQIPKRRQERAARVASRLREVGLPERVSHAYPHELSGGMRQRVALAAALDAEPSVLIADEPTTALDVTTQREILTLLTDIRQRRRMALVLITHNLALARHYGDDVVIMRSGRIIERGAAQTIFSHPTEDYTRALVEAEPRLNGPTWHGEVPHASADTDTSAQRVPPLVQVSHLVKEFHSARRGGIHRALDDVSMSIKAGELVGVVGKSGSGKTTLARCIIGLETPDSGTITVHSQRILHTTDTGASFPWNTQRTQSGAATTRSAGPVSIVFQNPYSTLNPAMSIGDALNEALRASGSSAVTAAELLESVELPERYLKKYPATLSGGERQRVAIARALATEPDLLICDEAVSALDVSVQAQILELLLRVQREQNFALVFITHDLAVARHMSTRLIVMNDGQIVEEGATDQILFAPRDAYTRSLIESVPGGVTRINPSHRLSDSGHPEGTRTTGVSRELT